MYIKETNSKNKNRWFPKEKEKRVGGTGRKPEKLGCATHLAI